MFTVFDLVFNSFDEVVEWAWYEHMVRIEIVLDNPCGEGMDEAREEALKELENFIMAKNAAHAASCPC